MGDAKEKEMKEQNSEAIGQAADRIDSLVAGLEMKLPPQMHIDQLKKILPEISKQIKDAIEDELGEKIWD